MMSQEELVSDLSQLISESQNPETMDIDLLSSEEIVQKINAQDQKVALAVEKVLPDVAKAVDRIVASLQQGGKLVYIGAGTSGRLGVLDAVECAPTYGIPDGMVTGIIAGGEKAMFKAVEGAEDDEQQGARDLRTADLLPRDVLVGIAASGRTPYVAGAMKCAQALGATVISLSCNANSLISEFSEISINPVLGPEVLAGSTRMKSGTAQKLVLNMLTTASMIRMGKSFRNLMIDLKASNEKLKARATRIVMLATEASMEEAEQALQMADNKVKPAIMMLLTGLSYQEAEQYIANAKGFLRRAVEVYSNRFKGDEGK